LNGEFPLDRAAEPSWLTVPLSVLYRGGVALDQAWRSSRSWRAAVPVISIGGLTVGGSGKTPFVIALCQLLYDWFPELRRPHAVTVLSRGYGRVSPTLVEVQADSDYRECGDEPLLIKRAQTNVGVLVHGERRVSAQVAVEKLGARLLVLDDGFQHRQLARDADIVVVDGAHPFGNYRLLPAGPLREPVLALGRATLVMGYGAASSELTARCAQRGVPLLSAMIKAQIPPQQLGKRCFAFCGIARPTRFFAGLDAAGVDLVGMATFTDHYRYKQSDLVQIEAKARDLGADVLITTAKDAVRLAGLKPVFSLIVADIGVEISDPGALRTSLGPALSRIVLSG
jgi:tetraacyldisaccharide 4'-kinase